MLRESNKMTVRELAAKCNLSPSYISGIENNKANPTIDKLKKIADVFSVPVKYLINGEEIEGDNKELLLKISKLDKNDKELIKNMIERFKKG
ncbi:helix-turn-helix domain-containing protein [Clostridium estertheticum]|nr:helix-turn-helix transcriptional regulator [Clostridium estertheticum]